MGKTTGQTGAGFIFIRYVYIYIYNTYLCVCVYAIAVGDTTKAYFFAFLSSLAAVATAREVGCMIRHAKKQLEQKLEEWRKQDETAISAAKTAATAETAEAEI